MLAERRRAEEGLAEAAGRHEQATAALYRLRSAVERLELRRERAEETAAALRADADRPRLPPAPKPPSYERALDRRRRLGAGARRAAGGRGEAGAGARGAARRARRPLGRGELVRGGLDGGCRGRARSASTREEALRRLAELAERAAACSMAARPSGPRVWSRRSGRASTRAAAAPASSARSCVASAGSRRSFAGRRPRRPSVSPQSGSSARASRPSARRSCAGCRRRPRREALTEEEADELRGQLGAARAPARGARPGESRWRRRSTPARRRGSRS